MKSKKFKIVPLIWLALGLLYLSWHLCRHTEEPFYDQKVHFYSNQCDDDFSPMIQKEIKRATKSIYLSIYALQDPNLVTLLDEKASSLPITLTIDPKTGPVAFKNIEPLLKSGSALMHQKILVIDEEKVLIGSANFTADSLHIDDNFIASFTSKKLSQAISQQKMCEFDRTTFWPLPQTKKEAYTTLFEHLQQAKQSIKVAMFTWTHVDLTNLIIEAHKKGVQVTVILDKKSAEGTSKKTFQQLQQAGIAPFVSPSHKTLHHKMALIDDEILFFGSANWTKAAFAKNDECLLMIKPLNKKEKKKIKSLFHACQCEATRPKIGH